MYNQSLSLEQEINLGADFFFACVGYEQRATAVSEKLSDNCCIKFALEFENTSDLLNHSKNRTLFQDKNFEVIENYVQFLDTKLDSILKRNFEGKQKKLVCAIDISSMSRSMIFSLMIALQKNRNIIETVIFVYSPSEYIPQRGSFPRIDRIGTDLHQFSGYNSDPNKKTALVMGVGYEYGVSIGILNQIEPNYALILRAIGGAEGFEADVRRANLNFDYGGSDTIVSEYDINNPLGTFLRLENSIASLAKNYRVIMIPMGPKILACLMGIISLQRNSDVALWRVARQVNVVDAAPQDFCIQFKWAL